MPQPAFLAWTAAGSLLWVSALTLAGLALGAHYAKVLAWLEPIGGALLAALTVAAGLAVLVWLWRRR
jgi:membrane protein DedA with SNARE-associated domain